MTKINIRTPDHPDPQEFSDAKAAVAHLITLYEQAVSFLCAEFAETMQGRSTPTTRIRAY